MLSFACLSLSPPTRPSVRPSLPFSAPLLSLAQRSLTKRTAAKLNMILRYTFNLPISLKKLQDLLQYKYIESEDLERESVSGISVTFQ